MIHLLVQYGAMCTAGAFLQAMNVMLKLVQHYAHLSLFHSSHYMQVIPALFRHHPMTVCKPDIILWTLLLDMG